MISIGFHYETFLLLFLVSALVICIVLKLKRENSMILFLIYLCYCMYCY